ncbi:MAG: hypothetical protein ACKO8I_03605, partial [Cyanobacteriota bacterium]
EAQSCAIHRGITDHVTALEGDAFQPITAGPMPMRSGRDDSPGRQSRPIASENRPYQKPYRLRALRWKLWAINATS